MQKHLGADPGEPGEPGRCKGQSGLQTAAPGSTHISMVELSQHHGWAQLSGCDQYGNVTGQMILPGCRTFLLRCDTVSCDTANTL